MRAALVGALIVLGAVAAIVWPRSGGKHEASEPRAPRPRPAVSPVRLSASVAGNLSAPEQDAAVAAPGPASTVLLGGLTAADTSRPDIVLLRGAHERSHATLPQPLHDAAAVAIGRSVYVFGGANVNQSDQIFRFSPGTGKVVSAGKLPGPLSDIAAAAVGGTAYIVGGFDGSKASDRILAWQPGGTARTVARLPHPLRYAAVAALGPVIYIAGGTSGNSATRNLLAFDTRGGQVTKVSRLPHGTTHAAAAAFGCCVYVIGGRGIQPGTPTRRIFAFDPVHRHLQPGGRLPVALSDIGAVTQRRRILVFGGRGTSATVGTIVQLRPRT